MVVTKPKCSTMGASRALHSIYFDKQDIHLKWPDCVIEHIFSLEHEVDLKYEGDIQKYNQKMRQLVFNLKVRILASYCLLLWCQTFSTESSLNFLLAEHSSLS